MWTSVWKYSRRKAVADEPGEAELLQARPRSSPRRRGGRARSRAGAARGPGASGGRRGARAEPLDPAEERQPVGEPDREEELGHDRVGIAAIRVVVLQDRRDGREAAQEVDQEHPGDGVAAELVERLDPSRTGFGKAAL